MRTWFPLAVILGVSTGLAGAAGADAKATKATKARKATKATKTTTARADRKELARRCSARDGDACTELADAAVRARRWRRAARLYARACDLGDYAKACDRLGVAYFRGRGVREDAGLAVTLFEKACVVGGSSVACQDAGAMFDGGDGVRRDADRAAELNRRAVRLYQAECDDGDERACLYLAALVDRGDAGVAQDTTRARGLYAKARKLRKARRAKTVATR